MSELLLVVGAAALLLAAGAAWTGWGVRRAERREPPSGRVVIADGVGIHVRDEGDGPPVVLIHGTDGLLEDFQPSLLPALTSDHRCLAFDRPGHGWSERRRGERKSPAADAALLRAACRSLGVERPVLLGHSYGGAVALRWALDTPDEVAGVVLVSPATHPDPFFERSLHRLALAPVVGPLVRRALLRPVGTVVVGPLLRVAFSPERPPPSYRRRMRALALRPAQFQAHCEEVANLSDDLRAQCTRYASLALPVAVVAARDDRITRPERHAERLAAERPATRLTLLPRGGHELHQRHVETVAEALRWVESGGRP